MLGTGVGTVFVAGMSAGHLTVLVGWNIRLSSSASLPTGGCWLKMLVTNNHDEKCSSLKACIMRQHLHDLRNLCNDANGFVQAGRLQHSWKQC